MIRLIVKQKVRNFDQWFSIFSSHKEAQKKAGLSDPEVYRKHDEPDVVICILKVTDLDKARAFVSAPEARQAQKDSQMLSESEVLFMKSI